MPCIDLNCDLGEGAGHDAELMPLVTTASIACGAHAGDTATLRTALVLARRHGVAIGAHPGYADREHFGRREVPLAAVEMFRLIRSQIDALQTLAAEIGAAVGHVKLHGALYNLAARDPAVAAMVLEAVWGGTNRPALFVPAGSVLETAARAVGTARVIAEAFADRTYEADGRLTPRSRPDAVITDEEQMVEQVLRLVGEGVVRTTDGTDVFVSAQTICLHGDGPRAVAFAHRLRRELTAAGIEVRAYSAPAEPEQEG